MIAFTLFIIVHTALILIVHFQDNIRNIVLGTEQGDFGLAITIAIIALIVVALIYVWASWETLRNRRGMQHALGFLVDPVRKALLQRAVSKQHYKKSDISPYFWVNGRPPDSEEYRELARYNFGIMGALERHPDLFQFVQVRHEEMAAFMASGHAKFTGELGVCMATSGPGAIHLLNGLYDAKMDHKPVLAIVGQSARSALE